MTQRTPASARPATGNLYYDADGSGKGSARLTQLSGAPFLAATDIAVI